MPDTDCKFLQVSAEAYQLDPATGESTPARVHLCDWPDQSPDRFVDAPRWLLRLVGSGLAVQPERDCVGCPAYRSKEHSDA